MLVCLCPASTFSLSGCPEAMQTDRYCSSLHYWRMPRAEFFVVKAKTPGFKKCWGCSWILDGKSTQFTAYAQLPLHSPRGTSAEALTRARMEPRLKWIQSLELLEAAFVSIKDMNVKGKCKNCVLMTRELLLSYSILFLSTDDPGVFSLLWLCLAVCTQSTWHFCPMMSL